MRTTNNAMSTLVDQRADEVAAGRKQIDARRATIERYRAHELAEAEALALARIKADTERALAHQSQVMRDAERAAELKAIERRSADLEATKEAQRRRMLDQEAATAAAMRSEADTRAVLAAREKAQALTEADETRLSRLNAEREAKIALRDSRRARISLVWIALRSASPIAVGLVALLVGIGIGWICSQRYDRIDQSEAIAPPVLKFDTELAKPARRR